MIEKTWKCQISGRGRKRQRKHRTRSVTNTAGQDALDSLVSPNKCMIFRAFFLCASRGRQNQNRFFFWASDFRDGLPVIDHESQMQRLLEYQVASMGDKSSKR